MQTSSSQFLRNVLRFDALTCFVSGAASLAFGRMLEAPLGLPASLLQGSGLVLLFVAAFILFAARNTPALRWPVWAVVISNVVWALDSVLLLLSDYAEPTRLGTAYVIAQAVFVVVLAELEYTGLRKITAVPAVALQE